MVYRSLSFAVLLVLTVVTAFSQDANPTPKVISAGIVNGKATNLVKPVYPPSAKAVNAGGTVNVQVTIGEDGSVIDASAVSGHPLLRAAATESARASTFAPTLLAGQPVRIVGVIVYNFVAPGSAKREISWLRLGFDLASTADPMTTNNVGSAIFNANVPEDWADVRTMLAQLGELRGAPATDGQFPRSSPEAITKAKEIAGLVELKLEEKNAELWRFRLGQALFKSARAVSLKSDEERRQAAFAIRELAFVTPPGVEVKTVDELTLMSDLVEKGNLNDDERRQFDLLHSKMQDLFN